MKLRKIDLTTADGLPALPMQLSWVRDGILVVGMDSEMHVYSQWKPDNGEIISVITNYSSIIVNSTRIPQWNVKSASKNMFFE